MDGRLLKLRWALALLDRFDVPDADSLLVVATEILDPTYLLQPFWTSSHFKRQNDASGWNPRPCSAR